MKINQNEEDFLGEEHVGTSLETPLRDDAFEMDDELKQELISRHFRDIMQILGLDLDDDSLKGTPDRVAKMYVKEVFKGLNPKNKPNITLFDNKFKYNEMLVEKDIYFHSFCEHHFVPIHGKAHVSYMSTGNIIGLSKLNRIVHYFAARPQVQERMTVQIGNELKEVLETEDVAVVLDAQHMCVACRGVQDKDSKTVTTFYSGKFKNDFTRSEFLRYIES